MTKRYRCCAPGTYGELERIAGITDREEFWRGKNESQARAEIWSLIDWRIKAGIFSPCWQIAARQPTAREINSHLASMTSYCYVDMPDRTRLRISRARTRRGQVEGRVILGSPKTWEVIPPTAVIELS